MTLYNGFDVVGQLTADQKRTLSMTKRTLIKKGIRFANVTRLSETIIPISSSEDVRASIKYYGGEPTDKEVRIVKRALNKGEREARLTYAETLAYNGQPTPPVRKPSANARRVKTNSKARAAKFRDEVIVKRATNRGGCFWGSAECEGKRWGATGQKWHYSCEQGRKYAAKQAAR